MHWPGELAAFLRRYRAPLSVAVVISGATTLLMLAVLGALFMLASHDSAEEVEESLAANVRQAARRILEGRPQEIYATEGVAIRLLDGDATTILVGRWPLDEGEHLDNSTSPLALAFASPSDSLCEHEHLPEGTMIEGCVTLAGLVEDRRSHLLRIGAAFGMSLVVVLAVSIFAARRALAPLRRATLAVENVDERLLEARLPVRGTDDDVDRHAQALNRVLERLEESFERNVAFTADVAHELRTPVNRILNLAEVALLRPDSRSREEGLDAIHEAAEQMRRLIEDMLLLARGDEGRLVVSSEVVTPDQLLAGLAELYRPKCEEQGLTLVAVGDPVGAKVVADRSLLVRALSNLIDNAVRHTPRGGRIELRVASEPGSVGFEVLDSGPGVPPEHSERIFDRFVQLDAARREGAGLGLPIARMIARRLGGELLVDDAPLGGARFTLHIPAGDPLGLPPR